MLFPSPLSRSPSHLVIFFNTPLLSPLQIIMFLNHIANGNIPPSPVHIVLFIPPPPHHLIPISLLHYIGPEGAREVSEGSEERN